MIEKDKCYNLSVAESDKLQFKGEIVNGYKGWGIFEAKHFSSLL